MTLANAPLPLMYVPPGYEHVSYHDFSNAIFYIDRCNLGLGMFANKDLAPDEVILTFDGPLIDFKETKTRGAWECMPIQIGIDRYIDTAPPGVFVNHSCSPNAGIKRDKDLIALRPVPKGSEIRFDYSTTMEENSFCMQCECGHSECRKIIADFSTLPSLKQRAYIQAEIVMGFILKSTMHS